MLKGRLKYVSAGAGQSGMFRGGQFAPVERKEIKSGVKQRLLRLTVATDTATEGLNLQTLGTLINRAWPPGDDLTRRREDAKNAKAMTVSRGREARSHDY